MSRGDVDGRLVADVDALGASAQAAFFWVAGVGLSRGLEASRPWAAWVEEVVPRGREVVLRRRVEDRDRELWQAMLDLSAAESGTQQLTSVAVCLSAPVDIVRSGGRPPRGQWAEHALLPLVTAESLRLSCDVAFPDDDEDLHLIASTPRVLRAAAFCRELAAALASEQVTSRRLDELAGRSGVLSPA